MAEFLRNLRKPMRFQWGRGSTIHFQLMGPFYIFGLFKRGASFYIFWIFKRGDPLLHFCDFQKGGGPGPPLNRPLISNASPRGQCSKQIFNLEGKAYSDKGKPFQSPGRMKNSSYYIAPAGD